MFLHLLQKFPSQLDFAFDSFPPILVLLCFTSLAAVFHLLINIMCPAVDHGTLLMYKYNVLHVFINETTTTNARKEDYKKRVWNVHGFLFFSMLSSVSFPKGVACIHENRLLQHRLQWQRWRRRCAKCVKILVPHSQTDENHFPTKQCESNDSICLLLHWQWENRRPNITHIMYSYYVCMHLYLYPFDTIERQWFKFN